MEKTWKEKFEKQRKEIDRTEREHDMAWCRMHKLMSDYKKTLPIQKGDTVIIKRGSKERAVCYVDVREDATWKVSSIHDTSISPFSGRPLGCIKDLSDKAVIIKDGVEYQGWNKPIEK